MVVLTNLDSGHANPGLIAHVVAGLVDHRSFRQTLTAIADTQPAITGSLARLLDQIVAGEDIRPPTTSEPAAADAGGKQKSASAACKGLAWRHAGTCEAGAFAGRG